MAIYRPACGIAVYGTVWCRALCVMTRIISPDSRRHTALMFAGCNLSGVEEE